MANNKANALFNTYGIEIYEKIENKYINKLILLERTLRSLPKWYTDIVNANQISILQALLPTVSEIRQIRQDELKETLEKRKRIRTYIPEEGPISNLAEMMARQFFILEALPLKNEITISRGAVNSINQEEFKNGEEVIVIDNNPLWTFRESNLQEWINSQLSQGLVPTNPLSRKEINYNKLSRHTVKIQLEGARPSISGSRFQPISIGGKKKRHYRKITRKHKKSHRQSRKNKRSSSY